MKLVTLCLLLLCSTCAFADFEFMNPNHVKMERIDFKSKKYFLGAVKSHQFDDTKTSAYAFDYSMMYEGGVLNFTRNKETQSLHEKEPADDLPY